MGICPLKCGASIHFDASDGRGPFPAHRSSSRPTPDVIRSRLFSHRSTPRSSAKAPVSGLRPPPRKAAPEVQNFLHLLVQHRGPRATLTHLPRSCSQRLLKYPHWASLPPRRLYRPACHADTGRGAGFRRLSGGWTIASSGDWGSGNPAIHRIARVPQRVVPYAWTRPLIYCHAAVPVFPFGSRLGIRPRNDPPSSSLLNREYDRAPRGAS